MSVSNGNAADQNTFNTSFISREVDSSTVGKIDLANSDVASGTSITNVQRELNGQASFVGDTVNGAKDRVPTWASDVIGTPNEPVKDRVESVQASLETANTNIAGNTSDIADIRTTLGTADGDTDMGTYTGTTIPDNVDQAAVNQALETAVEARILLSEKGAANGVATLDGTSRIPIAQLPTSVVEYKGAWNASTNTPTLADGVGDNGDLYRVSVAGTQNLGSGSFTYGVGDAIIYNGTIWQRIPANDAVTSVNSQSGVVVLDTDDIAEGATNLYYTNARADARIALASIDDLADVDTSTTPPVAQQALVWDGSNWVPGEATGGSGQGSKNYIPKGNFDNVDIAFVTTYDDVSAYVNGTGGTATNLTVTRNTTGPLAGDADLQIYKDGVADASHQGVTLLSETIDLLDLGRDLFLEFYYDCNDANYTSGNWRLYAYDVTNSAILPLVVIANLDADGGLLKAATRAYAKVLTTGTTQQVRISIHREVDTNPLLDDYLWIDEVTLGPSGVLVGTVSTEWQSYTPVWTGVTTDPVIGNGTIEGAYRRVGDSLEASIRIVMGGTTTYGSGDWVFSIPAGLSIDLDKLAANTNNTLVNSIASANDVSTSFQYVGSVKPIGDAVRVSNGDGVANNWRPAVPFTWASTDILQLSFTVPIVGWGAGNLLSSNETAHKSASAKAVKNVTQNIATATTVIVNYETVVDDEFNLITPGASWKYTSQTKGILVVSAGAKFPNATGWDIRELAQLYLYKNNTYVSTIDTFMMQTSDATADPNFDVIMQGTAVVDVVPGDFVDVRVRHTNGATLTLNADNETYINIATITDLTTFGSQGDYELITALSNTVNVSAELTGEWHILTGNSMIIPPGTWALDGYVEHDTSGGNDNQWVTRWSTVNGDGTATVPTALTLDAGNVRTSLGFRSTGHADNWSPLIPSVFTTSTRTTIYLNIATSYTTANGTLRVGMMARRIR